MTTKEAKRYLDQTKWLDENIETTQQEIDELRDGATSATSTLDATGSRSSGITSDPVGNTAVKVADLMRERNDKVNRLIALKQEIPTRIEALPDERLKLILRKKHILHQSWGKLASDMRYDQRHITRLYHRALVLFCEIHGEDLEKDVLKCP